MIKTVIFDMGGVIITLNHDEAVKRFSALGLQKADEVLDPYCQAGIFGDLSLATLRVATPLILGTLGVLLCERAGVLNLGIEGIMVAGAFTGWLTVYAGHGLWTGVLVAALTGAVFGLLHAWLTVGLALSQHVSGLGLTMLATALSYYGYRVSFPKVNTPPTINALGIATSDIAEMGLREISRTVMQAQRDQFFANREKSRYDDHTEQHETPHERSEQHGDHLQDAGWLSGAEPADAADAGGTSGQVRGTAESVPEEAPQSALHQPQDQRQADGASGGDRADRTEDGGADRGADGESRGRD